MLKRLQNRMPSHSRSGVRIAVSLILAGFANLASADPVKFEIPASDAPAALKTFSQQAKLQTLFDYQLVKDLKTHAVDGSLEPDVALAKLLEGTELTFERVNERTVAIRAVGKTSGVTESGDGRVRLAKAESQNTGTPVEVSSEEPKSGPAISPDNEGENQNEDNLEEILVTGSHIKGQTSSASPVMVFTQEDFAKVGATTPQQFFESLPQQMANRSPRTNAFAPANNKFDNSFGASVNLRGLGPGSTLVLVNGRRPAAAGAADYTDISMIPLSAVERIEIVTDGASAIYGADAVGGVVNFILKRQFNGADTLIQYSESSQGDGEQTRIAQTLGIGWQSGNVLFNYEYSEQKRIQSSDRSYSRGAINETNLVGPSKQNSAYVSARQNVLANSDLFADLSYTEHRVIVDYNDVLFGTGASDYSSESRQYGMAVGIDAPLSTTWSSEVVANWSRNEMHLLSEYKDPTLNDLFGTDTKSAFGLTSLSATATGTLMKLPAGNMKVATGLEFRHESYDVRGGRSLSTGLGGYNYPEKTSKSQSAFFEASLPVLRGTIESEPTLLLSAAGRYDHYNSFGGAFNPKVGFSWTPARMLAVRGTFGTSSKVPTLFQINPTNSSTIIGDYPDATGDTRSALLTGNSPNIHEETSTTWTLGSDLKLDVLEGLKVSVTYFNTDYEDRIEPPPSYSLVDPIAAGIIVRRGEVSDSDFEALLQRRIAETYEVTCNEELRDPVSHLCPTDPATIDAIIDGRLRNIARLKTSGLDLTASQRIRFSGGVLNFELNGTKILRYRTRVIDVANSVNLLDVSPGPVDVRVRGGISWRRNAWNVGTYVNYISSYEKLDSFTGTRSGVNSWTTFDANLGYEFQVLGTKRLVARLNAHNLFDKDPPHVIYPFFFFQVGYDPTYGDPFGRQLMGTLQFSW